MLHYLVKHNNMIFLDANFYAFLTVKNQFIDLHIRCNAWSCSECK